MAGKRLFVPLVFGFAILLALALSDHFASATVVKSMSYIRLCAATGTGQSTGGAGCPVQDNAAGSKADIQQWYILPAPDPNFYKINTITAPVAWTLGTDIPANRGNWMGKMTSANTLSILMGPCNSPVSLPFRFLASTTNTTQTIVWDEAIGGRNLANDRTGANCTGAANGWPDYVDCYPSFLNTMFDPDGSGPLPPLVPRSRLSSHIQITDGAPPTELSFVNFSPNQLTALPEPDAEFGAGLGYINFVVLNNPVGALMPSSITSFCTGLSTVTTTFAITPGNPSFIDDPAGGANETFEMYTLCNGADNDADGIIDDGCLRTPGAAPGEDTTLGEGANCDGTDNDLDGVKDDGCVVPDYCNADRMGDGSDNDGDTLTDEGCGQTALTNPAANTGISGTHIFGAYTQAQRDADNDGIETSLDPCALTTDAGFDASTTTSGPRSGGATPWDTDGDRLQNSCDPVPGTTSPVAGINCGGAAGKADQDQDCFPNLPYADRCPLVANGWETTGPPNQCNNLLDDDNDYVNDGCLPVGAAEAGAQCNNRFDDDQDGAVNDGCPQVGASLEAGAQCGNNTSDDFDGVNDGCPIVGLVAETGAQCDNAADDDTGGGDGTVNDGCPGLMAEMDQDLPRGSAATDSGPLNDGIGDACEPDWNGDGIVGAMVGGGSECISGAADCTATPSDWKLKADRPDGHYHKDFPRDQAKNQAACVGALDTDGDGWCDTTECVGTWPTCAAPSLGSDPNNNASTPENRLLAHDVDPAPQGCSDLTTYGVTVYGGTPAGTAVDNDGDTLANVNDPGCQVDADGDTVPNEIENVPADTEIGYGLRWVDVFTNNSGQTAYDLTLKFSRTIYSVISITGGAGAGAWDWEIDTHGANTNAADCLTHAADNSVRIWDVQGAKSLAQGQSLTVVVEACSIVKRLSVKGYWTNVSSVPIIPSKLVDNCQLVANANQLDADSDGLGDACDPGGGTDQDGDTVLNWEDNCQLVTNAGQADADSDGVGNDCDTTPIVIDADGDILAGTGTDGDEYYLGTDPLDRCPDRADVAGPPFTMGDPAWPLDQDNNGTILILDVTKYTGKLYTPVTCPGPDPNCRLDLDVNGTILILDVTKYTGMLYTSCVQ